jgi:TQXA domain-containing protein
MSTLSLLTDTGAPVTVRRRVAPMPVSDLSRMTRYRGGTYSHTVDTVTFTDGTSARTDLIRLNPNIEAYSLDFAAIAPMNPSRYRADTWSAVPHLQARAHETEVDWILRNSYPTLSTTELSRRLRAAGYPLGTGNIADHEAIAGTQAAIWRLTNGLELDNRPLNVPIRTVAEPNQVTFEFEGAPQLASYTVVASSARGAVLSLQKSVDGVVWRDVTTSQVTLKPGYSEVTKTLGVASTVSGSRHGSTSHGHRHYRLVITGDAAITGLRFRLDGSGLYRNAAPIVYLYDHLLIGARAARHSAVTPTLVSTKAVVDGALVGPFQLATSNRAAVAVSDGHDVVDADGVAIAEPIGPGADFYLQAAPGSDGATVTVTLPGTADGFGGRVITGVARDEVAGRYTPLALAVPSQLVVEFDIDWSEDLVVAKAGGPTAR